MKKKVLILGVCSLLLCGCGKIPTLSNGDEAVVTFKDGNMISANDFYEEIKNNFGLNTLLNMIDKFVFESEFADEMLILMLTLLLISLKLIMVLRKSY